MYAAQLGWLIVVCLLLPVNSLALTQAVERCEAQNIIYDLDQQVRRLDDSIHITRENLDDPDWIKTTLQTMADSDQLIRNSFINNSLSRTWSLETKRAFIIYFLNFDMKEVVFENFGYAQRHDYQDEKLLRRILKTSRVLIPEQWPTISRYDLQTDYNAWLIAVHANFYDKPWQTTILIPRLKRLAVSGDTTEVGYEWLEDPSMEHIEKMLPQLEKQGGPWRGIIGDIYTMKKFFALMPDILRANKTEPLQSIKRVC